MGFADMHIHSVYSDGTFTPEAIVTQALSRNVSLIAVCDHNVIQGTLETAELAARAGVKCISGVEIDAIFGGRDLHILCYGADLKNEKLSSVIHHARAALDGMSTDLLQCMIDDGYKLSRQEYDEFKHNTALGGWKMLQYLVACGIVRELRDAFVFYDRYGVSYEKAGFECAETVIETIHAAGGRAVLAHPGVSLPCENILEFEREVNAVMDIGADGIECYYPRHDRGLTQTCLRICKDRNLMITAGSDCHGAFNHNEIGCTRTPEENLLLKNLI